MSDRFTSFAAALIAAVLLIMLGGASAGAEPGAKRHHAPKPPLPQLDAPPPIGQPWLYVHCAANGYSLDEPCALDPAMRLNGDPVPGSRPSFGPAR